LGDLLTLDIQTQHPPGLVVEPQPLPKSLGSFEVFASTALNPDQYRVTLQNFTTGQQTLPGIAFSYTGGDQKPHVLKTPEFKVTITTVPAGPKDRGDIRGIKGAIGPVGISPAWWWLLVLALVIAGVAVWSHHRKARQGPPPEPPVPVDQMALERLRNILQTRLLEKGQIKEFYSAISDSVRAYIENGFACPALERTTSELLRDLRTRALFSSDKLVALKQLLEDCDLVKFAKFRPEAGEALKAHAAAVQFVEQTKSSLRERPYPGSLSFQGRERG
jgi:hypothetical protein